jgi:hypothetical protein
VRVETGAHSRGCVGPQLLLSADVRIETLPLILGVLIALLGIGIIFDAWTPDAVSVSTERRRRPRIERHRNGEALIGLGVLALAGAFIGRDNWRYSVLVVIIGAVFLVVGAILNRRYIGELFVNRGPLRRRDPAAIEADRVAPRDEADVRAPGRQRPESVLPATQPSVADSPLGEEGIWDGTERRSAPRAGNKRNRSREGPESAP